MAILTNQVSKKDLQNIVGVDPAPPESLDTLGELAAAIEGIEGINDIQAFQDEVDRIETSIGVMIDSNGNFVTPDPSRNFISTATSITNAIELLDTALKTEQTARTNADSNLTLSINANTQDIETLNLTLQAEITERQGNDANQVDRISALENDHVTVAQFTGLDQRIDQLEIDLPAEIQDRIDDVADLQAQINAEILARQNADSAIDTRIDDVELHHLHSNSFYANDGLSDIQTEIDNVGAQQGKVVFVTSGSFGGSTVLLNDKTNIAVIAPDAGTTICELAAGRGMTVSGTSERVRVANIQVEGALTINGTKGRHFFYSCEFQGGVTIDGTTDSTATFITFSDCSFKNQNINISNLTNCIVYFDRCSFGNKRIIPTNVASPTLIIVTECSGLNSLQTNLTSGVVLVGRTGYFDNTVKMFSTTSDYVNLGTGVITTFSGSYNQLTNKPTLVTAASQLSDYNTLLLTSMKGVANGVAELDSNGLIPNHHIPPLALTKPYVVQTIADRDALTGINTGDVAIVVNDPTPANNGNYIYDADLPSWIGLYNSTAPVNQVNGQIGDVTLYTGDIQEGAGANSEPSQLFFTDERALTATVTSNINTDNLAPSTQTVKSYVTGITDALDTRLGSVEADALTHATITYVDNQLAAKLDSASYTASDVLTKIKTVDGASSGLDADLLDGLDSSDFVKLAGSQTITGDKTFSGALIATTKTAGDNSTSVATTAYVDNAVAGFESVSGIRTAVGLNSSDSWSLPTSYYLGAQTVITGALNVLDTQVYNNNTVNTAQNTSLGLSSNGTKTDFSSTHYVTGNSSFKAAIEALDAGLNTVAGNVPTINNLSDINNVNVAENLGDNGKFLKWDNTTSKWVADSVPAGYTDNNAKDTVGAMFEAATGDITFTYDEATRTISSNVSAGSVGITQINGYTDATVVLGGADIQAGFAPSYYNGGTGDIKAHLQGVDATFNLKAGRGQANLFSQANTFANDAKYDGTYTLATSDNSTKFASTAWVTTKLGSITGALIYRGGYNALTGLPSLASAVVGDVYVVTAAGTLAGQTLIIGDLLIFKENVSGGVVQSSNFNVVNQAPGVASVNGATGSVTLTGNDINSGITATNYTAANAKIDSHLSGINTKLGTTASLSGNNTWTSTNTFNGIVAMAGATYVQVPTAGVDYDTYDVKAVNRIYMNNWVNSKALTKAGNLAGLTDLAGARGNLGLGTAAVANTGTSSGNVPVLGASGLPAVGGVNLTTLPSIDACSDVVITSATNGQVLSYNGTNWVNSAPGAAMSRATVITAPTTTPYAIPTVSGGVIEVLYVLSPTATQTVNLTNVTAAGNAGLKLTFKKLTAPLVQIRPATGEAIDGLTAGTELINQYASLTLISNGTSWSII